MDDGVFAAATGPSDEVIDALDDLTEFAEQAAPLLNGDLDLEGLLGDDFADSFGEDFDPQEFFEGLPFDLEGLGDGELDLGNLFGQLEDLQECFGPALEEANETGSFILPDCDIEELTTT